jgi:hypothetical protein
VGDQDIFFGNFLFASVNAFRFKTQSRRDDLISLCYMLVYMVDGSLPFLNDNAGMMPRVPLTKREEFLKVKKIKIDLTAAKLCQSSASKMFKPFVEKVFALRYDEEPNYSKLSFMLTKELLDLDQVPTYQYDWNEHEHIHTRLNFTDSVESCGRK